MADQDKAKQIKELQDERNRLQQNIQDLKTEHHAKEAKLKKKIDVVDSELVEAQSKLVQWRDEMTE